MTEIPYSKMYDLEMLQLQIVANKVDDAVNMLKSR